MREITQTEIENAPDWATDYYIHDSIPSALVGYYGNRQAWFVYENGGEESEVHSCYKSPEYAQPIPR